MLRVEALNITLNFQRTGPDTGRVSWNIPTPAAGCTSETQAYCGMLVTVSPIATTIADAPVDRIIYKADPTVDKNLFSGDKIGTTYVIGAFYNDRTTNMFDITGLLPTQAYYVTGYPVDCVFRYFREGVSAYSLNYTTGHGTPGTKAFQIVELLSQQPPTPQGTNPTAINPFFLGDMSFDALNPPPPGIKPTDATCLAPGVAYNFQMIIGNPGPKPPAGLPVPQGLFEVPAHESPDSGAFDNFPTTNTATETALNPSITSISVLTNARLYNININGVDAITFADLTDAINKQFMLLDGPPIGPSPPNAGTLFFNTMTNQLFFYDGYNYTELPVIISTIMPSAVVVGFYWYNPDTNVLYIWNGTGWDVVTVITLSTDPKNPICDTTYWFNGTQGYVWNGETWCEVPTVISPIDPSLPPSDLCDSYWLNTDVNVFYRWNINTLSWDVVNPVQYLSDPNVLVVGSYWFDSTNDKLFTLDVPNPGWNELFVRISETVPAMPAPGVYWYKPSTKQLAQFDGLVFVDLDSITYPTDPTNRTSCGLWYDTSTQDLYVWDVINSAWVLVTKFYKQDIDPQIPPVVPDGTVWFDPVTGIFYLWQGTGCDPAWKAIEFIFLPTDPTMLPAGTVWHDTTNDTWFVWNGTMWVAINPVITTSDPSMLPAGTYWYNPATELLAIWNGLNWINLMYTTVPPTPAIGQLWFNTNTQQLLRWNGMTWENAQPRATVQINQFGYFQFMTTTTGEQSVIFMHTPGNLFYNLCVGFAVEPYFAGSDGVPDQPTYDLLGVGTDGSLDERFQVANEVRYNLGYPVVDVEITKEQMDICITQAIRELRQRSALAYKHGFTFMWINPNQQKYVLTSKNAQMNKIVNIMGVYRLTSAFISSAHGAGIYGQVVLQHLYNMGTFDLLSYHIIASYINLLEILFAARLTFTWDEQTRQLYIFNRFTFPELVAIEMSVERTEQDIMSDRWSKPWIINFATAKAMEKLAEVRGKFSTLPSANGGVTLNAQDLRNRAKEIIEQCYLDIENGIADKAEDYGIGSQLMWG